MILSSLVLLTIAATQVASVPSPSCAPSNCRPDINTPEHRAQIVSNYLDLWSGRLDLLNQTLSPDVQIQIDRFPLSSNCSSGAGSRVISVNSSTEFGVFISSTRTGFDQYGFNNDLSFGQDNNVVIRWSLNAIIGPNFTVLPTTLKPGDPVTYRGTEMLILNNCTGLADEVYSAQDLISFFHNLGLETVTV